MEEPLRLYLQFYKLVQIKQKERIVIYYLIDKMEEVGKYQSLQDRINRLTNNRKADTQIKGQYKQTLRFSEIQNIQDYSKQKNRNLIFIKRKNIQSDLNNLVSPRQQKPDSIRNSQTFLNQKFRFSEIQDRETKLLLRKSKEQYILSKPARHQKQNSKYLQEMSAMSIKNDKYNNLSGLLSPKYAKRVLLTQSPEQIDQTQKSFIRSGKAQSITRRMNLSHSKNLSQTYPTRRDKIPQFGFQQLNNFKQDSHPQPNTSNQRMKNDGDQQFTGRIFKKCRSGLIERVPGKIIRNK